MSSETINKREDDSTRKGLIAWFARNPVAANLLMVLILVGGLIPEPHHKKLKKV